MIVAKAIPRRASSAASKRGAARQLHGLTRAVVHAARLNASAALRPPKAKNSIGRADFHLPRDVRMTSMSQSGSNSGG